MPEFHYKKISTCLRELKTGSSGLSYKEAERRAKTGGLNELPQNKPASSLRLIAGQFASPLIYILLFAGFISLAINEFKEALIIFGAVAVNAVIGFYQENKAGVAIAKLRQLVQQRSIVLRDGKKMEIYSRLLVAGDIIIIKADSRIPADARLIKVIDLQTNEAILTGESSLSNKQNKELSKNIELADRSNMVYAGTAAVRGSGEAVVTAIGADTEIGKIAKMVNETPEEKTPLQMRLNELAKQLGLAMTMICFVIFIIGLAEKRGLYEMFLTAVSLAVASIPEGMALSVTVILILGMQEILREKALTRKLAAAETLGSVTVICTDKTGTLTQGKMSVAHIIASDYNENKIQEQSGKNQVMRTMALCNSALIENPDDDLSEWRIIGDPTETALLTAAMESGLDRKRLEENEPKMDELPFDSKKKFMITVRFLQSGGFMLYEKGAPERVLEKCSFYMNQGKAVEMTPVIKKLFEEKYHNLTSKGLRVIAAAAKKIELWIPGANWPEIDNDLVFVGFAALKDPIRSEAEETINICRQAGIRPVMITGDHPLTARSIAEKIGLKVKARNIATGDELDRLSSEKLKGAAKKIDIYARVSPHHKLRIIKALQEGGEVVAMIGDGINDAPALKAADIGVCLGNGTDIAKETSDIILLDNNFKTIVSAVRQGRIIFSNIQKVVVFLISDSFSEIILIAGSIFLNLPLAILPAQILWINIINDGLPNIGLAYEKGDDSVMNKKPIGKEKSVLNRKTTAIILSGLIRDVLLLTIFVYFVDAEYDINYIRTIIFAVSGIDSLIYIYSLRDLHRPIWKIDPFSNKFLNISVLVSFALMLAGIFWRPLSSLLMTVPIKEPEIWVLIFSIGAFSAIIIEAVKAFINKQPCINKI